jgi:hypothetical protein
MTDRTLFARSTCGALVITCSDFRFKSAERRFLEAAGLTDDYDLIARPGGIRSIVQPRDSAAQTSMNDEIRLLWGLHKFTRILAINHLSCRAYDDLATAQNERSVHTAHLQRARDLLAARFAAAKTEAYLVALEAGEMTVQPIW